MARTWIIAATIEMTKSYDAKVRLKKSRGKG
jgi:hypothetical protein